MLGASLEETRVEETRADVVARERHLAVSNHHISPIGPPPRLSDVKETPFAVSTIPSIPSILERRRGFAWRQIRHVVRGTPPRWATRDAASRRRAPRKPNHDRSNDETTRIASVASVATATPNRDEETRRGCHRATRAPCRRFENVSQ